MDFFCAANVNDDDANVAVVVVTYDRALGSNFIPSPQLVGSFRSPQNHTHSKGFCVNVDISHTNYYG